MVRVTPSISMWYYDLQSTLNVSDNRLIMLRKQADMMNVLHACPNLMFCSAGPSASTICKMCLHITTCQRSVICKHCYWRSEPHPLDNVTPHKLGAKEVIRTASAFSVAAYLVSSQPAAHMRQP
jgi:hypothetical protein